MNSLSVATHRVSSLQTTRLSVVAKHRVPTTVPRRLTDCESSPVEMRSWVDCATSKCRHMTTRHSSSGAMIRLALSIHSRWACIGIAIYAALGIWHIPSWLRLFHIVVNIQAYIFVAVYCMNLIIFFCVTLKLFFINIVPPAADPSDALVSFLA